MTISKKLSIAITLALGIHMATGAFYYKNDYGTDKKSAESGLISRFTQDLYNQNSRLAAWLDSKSIYEKRNIFYNVRWYPIAIVEIITDKHLTHLTKIDLLSKLMAQEKPDNKKHTGQEFVNNVCGLTFCVCVCAFTLWATNPEYKKSPIKNMLSCSKS